MDSVFPETQNSIISGNTGISKLLTLPKFQFFKTFCNLFNSGNSSISRIQYFKKLHISRNSVIPDFHYGHGICFSAM